MVTNSSDPSSNPAATNNPNFPRKNLTSPWAQVVRGADSEPINHQSPPLLSSSSSLDSGNSDVSVAVVATVVDDSNADQINNAVNPKKPAWKNQSNDVVSDVSPLAVSWPALSNTKSVKASVKLTPDSSSVNVSISVPQGAVTPNSPQKQATSTANASAKPTPPLNHGVAPNRPKSMKNRGGVGGNGNTNINSVGAGPGPLQNNISNPPQANLQQTAAPRSPLVIPPATNFANTVQFQPHRNNNGWGPRSPMGAFVPPVNEHRSHSNRGNFGNRLHNNHNIRRNQDLGNLVNTRDAHLHQQWLHSGGHLRPTLPNSTYFGPQPFRPFVNNAGFHEFYYPITPLEQFGGMPFMTTPTPTMFFPVAETFMSNTILGQIDYYFSEDNLVRDYHLRSKMDQHGWIPVTEIANFPRVKDLTDNINLILDSMRISSIVEVQGDKLRRRNDWERWLPSAQRRVGSGSASLSGANYNNIATDFDKITLNEETKQS